MEVQFKRAAWRPWLLLLLAVPALALALDLTITDRAITDWVLRTVHAPSELRSDLARSPEQREDGGLSYQGESERRADVAWGIFFWLAAGGLLFWGFTELTTTRRVLSADDDGMRLMVGSAPGHDVFVPWDQVRSVRSTVDDGPAGRQDVLEVVVEGPTWIPPNPSYARWDGNRLLVTAGDWATPAHEAAGVLETLRERAALREQESAFLEAAGLDPLPPESPGPSAPPPPAGEA